MKSAIFLLLFALFGCGPVVQSAERRGRVSRGDIVVFPLRGEVAPAMFVFLRRAQKAAESAGAGAMIIEMNTYGGRLETAEQITNLLNHATIPTYTFINTNAGSAGALIALATRHIYMAPVSAIGAAAPILANGTDLPSTARDKTISYWAALIRSSATRNAHNPDVGEAFMDKEKEVKIGDQIVHAKGSLLTLNAQEAAAQWNGKPLLADGIVESIAELTRSAALTGKVVAFEPAGFERLAFWITSMAPVLLLVGIVCAYLEFKIPGVTLPGLVAAVCFALFFLGHYFAGLAGWEAVVLFLLGVLFLLVEIFFFAHSTILFGIVGLFLILASLAWAMIDRYPGDDLIPNGAMLRQPLLNLVISIVAAAVVIAVLARFLPRTNMYRRFVLSADIPSGPSFAQIPAADASPAIIPGALGRALTTLRPSGKAKFADQVIDVVTDGEFVVADQAIAIVSRDGMRIVVKAIG
ncbi:MAG: nodulation protein NfeD [Chthoniobacterales bacterium]